MKTKKNPQPKSPLVSVPPSEPKRSPLSCWLSGAEKPDAFLLTTAEIQAVLDGAVREQVAPLLEWRLRQWEQGGPLQDALRAPAVQAALNCMLMQAEADRLLRLLAALQTPALLLKGSALAWWLYPEPHLRVCGDIDVLVPSRAMALKLAAALEREGYERWTPSGEWAAHELMCTRKMGPNWRLEVDIHWRLSNTTLFAYLFDFDELMAASIALPRLSAQARALCPAHALVHATIHRASNLTSGVGDGLKWLYDLHLLSQMMCDAEWAQVLEVAVRKQTAGVILSGLEAAAQAFGSRVPSDVARALQQAAQTELLDPQRLADWRYMQALTFKSLPSWRARAAWLWQRVFPSADYLQSLYGRKAPYAVLMMERLRRLSAKWQQR